MTKAGTSGSSYFARFTAVLRNVFVNEDKEYLGNFLRLLSRYLKGSQPFKNYHTPGSCSLSLVPSPELSLCNPQTHHHINSPLSHPEYTIVFQQLPTGSLRILGTSSNVFTHCHLKTEIKIFMDKTNNLR